MSKNAIFIAATGQNVGKTTLCLGLMAGLKKRFSSVGFIKPVGQQHIKIDGDINVDKDVILFKKHFSLETPWEDMSPVIVPSGVTKDYLDGKFSEHDLFDKISLSFEKIVSENDYTVVEGTGHVGVGSIINLNNAAVAAKLGVDIVLIASGGLGSAHDELALNLNLCEQYKVKVRGIILNRVIEDKREMVLNYFPKSLKKWNVPLIGCVPYSELLSQPSMQDFATLFHAQLFSGEQHRYRHFQSMRLVADSVEIYAAMAKPNELVITPASREKVILKNIELHRSFGVDQFAGGMILTGYTPPDQSLIEKINELEIPALYTPHCSFDTMKLITSFIGKIRTEDQVKVNQAIQLIEEHVDFNALTNIF